MTYFTRCSDCGQIVEAEFVNNGVAMCGHYVHCGWGHDCSPDDLFSTFEKAKKYFESPEVDETEDLP